MYELGCCSLLLLLYERNLTNFSKYIIWYEYHVFSRRRQVLILSYRLHILYMKISYIWTAEKEMKTLGNCEIESPRTGRGVQGESVRVKGRLQNHPPPSPLSPFGEAKRIVAEDTSTPRETECGNKEYNDTLYTTRHKPRAFPVWIHHYAAFLWLVFF